MFAPGAPEVKTGPPGNVTLPGSVIMSDEMDPRSVELDPDDEVSKINKAAALPDPHAFTPYKPPSSTAGVTASNLDFFSSDKKHRSASTPPKPQPAANKKSGWRRCFPCCCR